MFYQTRLRDFFQNGGFVIILFHCIVVEVLLLFPTRFILFKVRARLRTKRGKEKDPDTQRFMSFLGKPSKKYFCIWGVTTSLHYTFQKHPNVPKVLEVQQGLIWSFWLCVCLSICLCHL